MKLLLICPRFKYASGDVPIGLVSLATFIKSNVPDIQITLIDGAVQRDKAAVVKWLMRNRPDIVGIYADSLMYDDAMEMGRAAKQSGAHVIVGGPHATVLPDTVIYQSFIDAVCVGEGEHVLLKYIQGYSDKKGLPDIPGLWYKENGNIVKNARPGGFEDLDLHPRLDFGFLDLERYLCQCIHLDSYSPGLRLLSVMASRGCLFNCAYCQPVLNDMFGRKLRIRSAGKMLDDLIYWRDRYRINAVFFQDDTLTLFQEWMKEFCELAIERKLKMVWACNSRSDTLNFKMLDLYREAGCVKIRLGIETVSDRVRNGVYNKKLNLDVIRESIVRLKEKKIQASGYFMIGAPTESDEEIRSTIRFACESRLDEAVFTICSPLPGTHLYAQANDAGWNLSGQFGDFDYYQARTERFTPSDVATDKLNYYKKLAYCQFYCHPKRLAHTLKTVLAGNPVKTINKLRVYF
ncbi:MAG TPA: radical SAM protein [Candidatus Omnitrophota bacterium]|nr:radical SAM protein [Candidatus Omnitrophota bacterium]